MKQPKPAESAMPISEEQGSPSKAAKTTHAAAEEEAPPNKAAKTTDAAAEEDVSAGIGSAVVPRIAYQLGDPGVQPSSPWWLFPFCRTLH